MFGFIIPDSISLPQHELLRRMLLDQTALTRLVRAAAVLATGRPPSTHDDYQIEILVMQLYGITRSMCRRIFDVLHEVQRLRSSAN